MPSEPRELPPQDRVDAALADAMRQALPGRADVTRAISFGVYYAVKQWLDGIDDDTDMEEPDDAADVAAGGVCAGLRGGDGDGCLGGGGPVG